MRRPSGPSHFSLLRSRLLRDNDRHDQVHDGDPAEAGEEREDDQQTHKGRVDAEIFAQARADTRDHPVRRTASQLFVVVVHDVLLSMISTRTYAVECRRLQTPPVPQSGTPSPNQKLKLGAN